ncbi:hypothetical protein L1987_30455 [Smallanthus sonchifolius]|uniref:Uncharacterized protein n=1 Tax=Smallanthus sonchifolius TaxID=185202 RepID=A0ACB9I4N1_9ASTR|nr:hypothetical protein L1987_30455 [Smallanthus sonchifolius]
MDVLIHIKGVAADCLKAIRRKLVPADNLKHLISYEVIPDVNMTCAQQLEAAMYYASAVEVETHRHTANMISGLEAVRYMRDPIIACRAVSHLESFQNALDIFGLADEDSIWDLFDLLKHFCVTNTLDKVLGPASGIRALLLISSVVSVFGAFSSHPTEFLQAKVSIFVIK